MRNIYLLLKKGGPLQYTVAVIVILAILATGFSSQAQLALTNGSPSQTINFSTTVSGVLNGPITVPDLNTR